MTEEEPPQGHGFDPEFLSTLRFPHGDQAAVYLKALALQNGFVLSLRDSTTSEVIRFYCHRSNRGHGEKSTKTDCQFHLKLRRHPEGYAVMEKSVLDHNHPMLPNKPPSLPRAMEDHIKVMARIGVPRATITTFVHELTGTYLSRSQLAAISGPEMRRPSISETEQLIREVEKDGGVAIPWEVDEEGELVRAAVFTMTPIERMNIEKFGDVLFLDGTSIRNELGWTTFPVTLIDDANHLVSGGLLFMAYERTELFCWLLQLLLELIGDKLRTIFTDEDLAMLAAFDEFHREHENIRHRLCVWHKRNNFERHAQAAAREAKVANVALGLFDTAMYDPSRDKVIDAIEQLRVMLPKLSHYIDTEIIPLLPRLAEGFRDGAFTLGRRSNQVGESGNNMLRKVLPAGVRTLIEIRNAYTQAYLVKSSGELDLAARAFHIVHFTEARYGIKLHRTICSWIDRLIAESKLWKCTQIEPILFSAQRDTVEWRMIFNGRDDLQCQCNATSGTGLPCCHLIALFHQLGGGEFPAQLIAPRWIPNFADIVMPELPALTLREQDVITRILSEGSSDDETPPAVPDDDEPIHAGRDDQTQRYKRMLAIGKEVAQKASTNLARYDEVLSDLERIRDSLTRVVHGEIRDAAGRPKGRPRGKGYSQPDSSSPVHCPLCDSSAHNLPDCPYHKTFRKAQKRFTPVPDGKVQCRLCSYRGHRATTCPVVRMAREMLREVNGRRKPKSARV